MIARDQFTNVPQNLLIAFSSRSDGTVLDRSRGVHADEMVNNRKNICAQLGLSYDDMVYMRIMYDEGNNASYECYAEVDARSRTIHTSEVITDALFTKQQGVGLFLPIADCIPTVIYDAKKQYIALVHMGRHSTLTGLLAKMIQKFVREGSEVADIQVWMGPAATKASYTLKYFDHEHEEGWQGFFDKSIDGYHLDMQGYNKRALENAGVLAENITISPIDTVKNDDYFSHSAGDTHGRFACIAMMR